MIRLIGLVVSIGIADSLNPTTIAPGLYLAAGDHARRQVAEFTVAVFVVYLLGGLAIALGPGELLLAVVPRPGRHLSYVLEIVAGAAMLAAAAVLWGYRERLVQSESPTMPTAGRSSALLGATITAVELPTAFPYFAAIAAVVGADLDVTRVVFLLVIFNVCFVAPLLGILATLTFAGPDAQRLLTAGREWLEARWPAVLAILALLAGLIVCLLGVTGLAAAHHNDFGTFSRRLRHYLHLHT
ncbi:MAG TPA: GAP family protein [Solirubrobacteraceae bacterium]|jgi:cytochrome c biogenesis protein CcdA|nr:GAP family protein [Solirubrobacteraceae bacterium]